jgi:hypothetical protein
MHVREALDRLEAIHDQLTRSEVYRGFRVRAVVLVGLLGFLAAGLQPHVPGTTSGIGFVWLWVAVAGACGLIGTAAAVHSYVLREDGFDRRRTRRVMAQFAPCILAGAAITFGVARVPDLIGLLPGLFGLGVIAARPHLPPAIGLVGLGYVLAGGVLLLQTTPGDDPSPWAVGGVFGAGHLVTAFVLWHGLERESDG